MTFQVIKGFSGTTFEFQAIQGFPVIPSLVATMPKQVKISQEQALLSLILVNCHYKTDVEITIIFQLVISKSDSHLSKKLFLFALITAL